MNERYYNELLLAYLRVATGETSCQDAEKLMELAKAREIKFYDFKRCQPLLPRVKMVLSFLKAIQFDTLLDVGSGRGAFLWPFMDEFPHVETYSVDLLPHRIDILKQVRDGGITRLHPQQVDICQLDFDESSVDVVTLLEVLEHIPDVEAAVRNAVRIARQCIIVSVPSKPDDNPEHIHLLTKDKLTTLFTKSGCTRLNFSGVPGHLVMMAFKEGIRD